MSVVAVGVVVSVMVVVVIDNRSCGSAGAKLALASTEWAACTTLRASPRSSGRTIGGGGGGDGGGGDSDGDDGGGDDGGGRGCGVGDDGGGHVGLGW